MTGTSVRKVDDLVHALGRRLGDLQVLGVADLRRLHEVVAAFTDRGPTLVA